MDYISIHARPLVLDYTVTESPNKNLGVQKFVNTERYVTRQIRSNLLLKSS